jgi:hypothetical protein
MQCVKLEMMTNFIKQIIKVKLCYSNGYKERVMSLSLSSSKSIILTFKTWKQFRKLIPTIEDFFENDV